jgi:hypothetical protein
MKRTWKALTMTAGLAAMLGMGTLEAAVHKSETVQIPFAFKVQHKDMPAGMYRIVHESAGGIATLVNVKNGERVQLLHSTSSHAAKTKLIFEQKDSGYVLKRLA